MVFFLIILIAMLVYAFQFQEDYKEEDLSVITVSLVAFIFLAVFIQILSGISGV